MKKIILMLLVSFSTALLAVEPKSGVNFKTTKNIIPTESKDKIEVIELFWYGCIHCFNMDPYLDKWADNLPKDVTFKRIPAIPRKDWIESAKAYYALETLGVVNKLHEKLFDAIHKEKSLKHNDTRALIKWITVNGKLDKKDVESAFNSFSMKAKLSRSYKIFKSAGATGVPTMIIDGKYFTSSTMAGSEQNAIDIMNFIIKNVRNDKSKK
ncbi:thiol:disulfide interchange protein DsbA/DsbL [Nitrosomonadales bacterium]|nr:thiol:disulfide interchange protein DsbA/DsbL [Nitrosomonadales bacterium]